MTAREIGTVSRRSLVVVLPILNCSLRNFDFDIAEAGYINSRFTYLLSLRKPFGTSWESLT